jgi:hypothetical protein
LYLLLVLLLLLLPWRTIRQLLMFCQRLCTVMKCASILLVLLLTLKVCSLSPCLLLRLCVTSIPR